MNEDQSTRIFLVHSKGTEDRVKVTGVTALSKLINVPVSEIPKSRMYKYTIGDYTVYDLHNLNQ